jgi:hypothetical protein
MLDALKAAMTLVDHLVQNPCARIQIRMPDSVGVKQIELVGLRLTSAEAADMLCVSEATVWALVKPLQPTSP